MKKELTLAALLMTSPIAQLSAQEITAVRSDFLIEMKKNAEKIYKADKTVMHKVWLDNGSDQKVEAEFSVELIVVPLEKSLGTFELTDIPAVKGTEYEIVVNYVPTGPLGQQFTSDDTFYAFSDGPKKIVIFNCSSSYSCHNDQNVVGVLKLDGNSAELVKSGEWLNLVNGIDGEQSLKFTLE